MELRMLAYLQFNAKLIESYSFFAYISSSVTIGHCNNFMIDKVIQFYPKSKLNDKSLYIHYGMKDPLKQATEYLPSFSELLSNQFKGQLRIQISALKDAGHVPEGGIRSGLDIIYKNK